MKRKSKNALLDNPDAQERLAKLSSVGQDGQRRFHRPIRLDDFKWLRRMGFRLQNIGIYIPLSHRQLLCIKLRASGMTVGDACREVGCAESTFWRWRNQSQRFRDELDRTILEEQKRLETKISHMEPRAVQNWERFLDGQHGDNIMYKSTVRSLQRRGLLPQPGGRGGAAPQTSTGMAIFEKMTKIEIPPDKLNAMVDALIKMSNMDLRPTEIGLGDNVASQIESKK